MEKQLIISIGREYGSGGHEIGRRLAERFGIAFYDRSLLDEIAMNKHVDAEKLVKYDEAPTHKFLTRTVRGFSSSPEQNIAEMQFEYMKSKADKGDSFVIVGRCSDTILKDYPGFVSVFIRGDYETKLERVMERRNFSAKKAAITIEKHDKNRRAYHNHYCHIKWGDSRNYDICVNSSKLGLDNTIDVLEEAIRRIMK